MIGAWNSLPEEMRRMPDISPELVGNAGNYPDYFDDPTRPDHDKEQIDPDWKTYTFYPKRPGHGRFTPFRLLPPISGSGSGCILICSGG